MRTSHQNCLSSPAHHPDHHHLRSDFAREPSGASGLCPVVESATVILEMRLQPAAVVVAAIDVVVAAVAAVTQQSNSAVVAAQWSVALATVAVVAAVAKAAVQWLLSAPDSVFELVTVHTAAVALQL